MSNDDWTTADTDTAAGIQKATDGGDCILTDEWRLQDYLRDADRAIVALNTFPRAMP